MREPESRGPAGGTPLDGVGLAHYRTWGARGAAPLLDHRTRMHVMQLAVDGDDRSPGLLDAVHLALSLADHVVALMDAA